MMVNENDTDQSLFFIIKDTTTWLHVGALTITNITSAYYVRPGAAAVAITTSNLALITTIHTDGGFLAVPNMVGLYRFDVPDAAFAAGVPHVTIKLNMASGYQAEPITVEIVQAIMDVSLV